MQLRGIDSVLAPLAVRQPVWQQLATSWKPPQLGELTREIPLADAPAKLAELLAGQARGRYVVRHA